MIQREVLQSLTEDEMAVMLYVLNVLQPPGFNLTVDPWLVASYKKDALMGILAFHRQHVLPEGEKIYDTLLAKLNGVYELVTKKNEHTTATESNQLNAESPTQEPPLGIQGETP
jgi:hypothetical protein